MRSIKEVVAEYEEVSKDSALVPKEGYINVFVFKNQSKRDALRKEYIFSPGIRYRIPISDITPC